MVPSRHTNTSRLALAWSRHTRARWADHVTVIGAHVLSTRPGAVIPDWQLDVLELSTSSAAQISIDNRCRCASHQAQDHLWSGISCCCGTCLVQSSSFRHIVNLATHFQDWSVASFIWFDASGFNSDHDLADETDWFTVNRIQHYDQLATSKDCMSYNNINQFATTSSQFTVHTRRNFNNMPLTIESIFEKWHNISAVEFRVSDVLHQNVSKLGIWYYNIWSCYTYSNGLAQWLSLLRSVCL